MVQALQQDEGPLIFGAFALGPGRERPVIIESAEEPKRQTAQQSATLGSALTAMTDNRFYVLVAAGPRNTCRHLAHIIR